MAIFAAVSLLIVRVGTFLGCVYMSCSSYVKPSNGVGYKPLKPVLHYQRRLPLTMADKIFSHVLSFLVILNAVLAVLAGDLPFSPAEYFRLFNLCEEAGPQAVCATH
jgi:hypothetical protein